MNLEASPRGFRITGWHVLASCIGFFGIVIAADTGFVVMSIRTFPGQVAVTPYEDGLLYDRTRAQQAAQERLGWKAVAEAEPGAVVIALRDAAGQPLSGLKVSGQLVRPATEQGALTLEFLETSTGRYVARPGSLQGAWDLMAEAADASGRRFTAERRLTWP